MSNTFLVLRDGTIFKGHGFGKPAPDLHDADAGFPIGEVVFNTSMTGYQEILTDPSYHGQMIVMTYPHIGNYGCEEAFDESTLCRKTIPATGMIVHSLYDGPLPKGRISLSSFMEAEGICGITGVDTRRLTLRLRNEGAADGLLFRGTGTEEETKRALSILASFPSITERNLIEGVSTKKVVKDPKIAIPVPEQPKARFALVDFGIKQSIIAELYKRNIAVTLFPPTSGARDILDSGCTALFLSNGPGDPALLTDAVAMTKSVIGRKPVLGICLGHQIITWALGGCTVKMKFGHHGANHPVRDLVGGRTFVTSQNHGFMTDAASLPDTVRPWFVNANDQTIEGLYHTSLPVRSVQFHPEASPGPHDGRWIFDRFIETATQGEA